MCTLNIYILSICILNCYTRRIFHIEFFIYSNRRHFLGNHLRILISTSHEFSSFFLSWLFFCQIPTQTCAISSLLNSQHWICRKNSKTITRSADYDISVGIFPCNATMSLMKKPRSFLPRFVQYIKSTIKCVYVRSITKRNSFPLEISAAK